MGLPGDEGMIFMLSKRVTESDARTGFVVAHDAYKLRYPRRRAPCDRPDGLPYPYLRWFVINKHECARKMRCRLTRLLASNDTPQTAEGHAAPDPRAALDAFLASNPLWAEAGAHCTLLFREFPSCMDALVLRLQKSGLCFLHAPLVAVHYLVSLLVADSRVPDVTTFMRRQIGDGGTARYLLNDSGGDTTSVLLQVLQPAEGSVRAELLPFPFYGPKSFSSFGLLIRKYGPGVVTSFRTERALKEPRTSYTGAHTSLFHGLHALILVGVRFDAASGKYFLLLQNSWERLPFFEVDEDYWQASEATVRFVVTPQRSLRAGFATNDLRSAESGVIGAGVAAPPLVGAAVPA